MLMITIIQTIFAEIEGVFAAHTLELFVAIVEDKLKLVSLPIGREDAKKINALTYFAITTITSPIPTSPPTPSF